MWQKGQHKRQIWCLTKSHIWISSSKSPEVSNSEQKNCLTSHCTPTRASNTKDLRIHQTSHKPSTSGTQKLLKSVRKGNPSPPVRRPIGMEIFEALVIEAHTAELYVHIDLDTKHVIKWCLICCNWKKLIPSAMSDSLKLLKGKLPSISFQINTLVPNERWEYQPIGCRLHRSPLLTNKSPSILPLYWGWHSHIPKRSAKIPTSN